MVTTTKSNLNDGVLIGGSGKTISGSKILVESSDLAAEDDTEIGTLGYIRNMFPSTANNVTTSDTLTANKIVLGNGNKTVKNSSYGILTSSGTSSSADTEIPT